MYKLKLRVGDVERWVLHYDKFKNDITATDNLALVQEYFSLETLLEEIKQIETNKPKTLPQFEELIIVCVC
jgi:hypothetical protein